ncbi:MAG: MFS transporter [Streptosporangiales bacterium]|nr:MFS transporter [Streptosporangiales bacterium]
MTLLEDSTAVQAGPASGSGTRRWLYVSLPLLVSFAVAQLVKTSMGIVAASPEFIDRFHVGAHSAAAGWASSSFLYAYGVALLFWGLAVKRIGPRRSMLAGTAIWVIALAITPFVHTVGSLYGTRILLGVGEACFYPVAHTLTARWFPMQERARANASWLSGIFVGSTVASFLTAFSLTTMGWSGAFFLQAGIALVLAFGTSLLLIRNDPRDSSAIASGEVSHIEGNRFENTNLIPKAGPESPYRNYRYWLTMLMYLGTNIPFYGLVTWLPLYLKDERHVGFDMVGVILTIANALSIVVMVGVGMWSDRKMRRAGIGLIGFVIEGIGVLGAVLFPTNTLIVGIWVFLGLAGNAWCIVTNWGLLHSFMPTDQAEKSSGLFSCLTNLVGAGVPALLGWMLATTGSYTPGFLLLVGTVVISIACCGVLIPQKY